MAVITGRYGAVEISRPNNKIVVEGGTKDDFFATWGTNQDGANNRVDKDDKLNIVYRRDENGDIEYDSNTGKPIIDSDLTKEASSIYTQYPNNGQQGGTDQPPAAKLDLKNNYAEPRIVSSMTSWTLENNINPIEFSASNTRGYKGKLAGLHDASGNISGLGAVPPLGPGQRFRFYGYTGPSNGLDRNTDNSFNNKGIVYAITAIVNSVQIQVSYQWNNPITWTIGWQADWHEEGDELWQFDAEDELGFWDFSKLPCCSLMPSTSKKIRIWREDNAVLMDELCLLDANIQFTNETAQYANSCSAKAGGWQSRLPGPTTCSVSTNIQGDDFWKTGSLVPGTNHGVQIFVGDENEDTGCNITWWYFHKLFFSGFSGLNVDTTSNTPLQFSCNMDFNAYPDCEPGYIMFKDEAWDEEAGEYVSPEFLLDLRTGDEYNQIPEHITAQDEIDEAKAAREKSQNEQSQDNG
jgi:hypothetical protein